LAIAYQSIGLRIVADWPVFCDATDMEQWRRQLARVLEQRKLDMKTVSKGAGLNAAALQQILKGGKDPQFSTVLKISRYLNLSIDELVSGVVPAKEPRSAPVIGETAAGIWLEPDSWDEAKYPAVPFVPTRYGNLGQKAYRVIGNSMNLKRIHDGSFVITVDYWEVRTQPQDGDLVIVERRRQGGLVERTLKEVVIQGDRIELTSRSSEERYRDPIVIPRNARTPFTTEDALEVEIIALVVGNYTTID
jgi:SOS-response transcriptional repressor LexA